jgi:hypothetical protein
LSAVPPNRPSPAAAVNAVDVLFVQGAIQNGSCPDISSKPVKYERPMIAPSPAR